MHASLPDSLRGRVHLASLPMEDLDENAAMVNAVQRHAAVIVQKSLAEGFGLTVTEGLIKGRPVVASAVGGILEQIEDGKHGRLLTRPQDPAQFADTVASVLEDPLGEKGNIAFPNGASREMIDLDPIIYKKYKIFKHYKGYKYYKYYKRKID